MTPYYEDADVTIYHGDLFALLHEVRVVDCAIADPPYSQTSLAWDKWPEGWPGRLAARTSSMWCFGTLRMFMERTDEFSDWKMSQDVVWEKHNGSSSAADRFRRVHEQMIHFYRGAWDEVYKSVPTTPDAIQRSVKRSKNRTAHWGAIDNSSYVSQDGGPLLMRSVIYEPSCHGYAENETQKPLGIIRPLIEYACPLGGYVLDCFMGSGSVLVTAKEMGRKAIGIDIRESQCEIAARRISQGVITFA